MCYISGGSPLGVEGSLPTLSKIMTDKLQRIFEMQEGLNKRIGIYTNQLNEDEQIHWILQFSRALQQEQAELIDSVPWKWWSKYQKFDLQNARVEVVDMLHFLVSMAQTLGMDADDVFETYCAKHRVNHARQDSGYTTKDENDSKHI